MVPSRAVSGRRRPAFDSFREAVLAFAEEPTPANFVRYRHASLALDGAAFGRRDRAQFRRTADREGTAHE